MITTMKTLLASAAIAAIAVTTASAQIEIPQPSPAAAIEQRVGLTDMRVEYGRPSLKGRKAFGDLVPFGKMWRTGANKATKVSFTTDIKFGGKHVPAGSFSLFAIPGEKEWTIILNKQTELWGTGNYNEKEDVVRITVAPEPFPFSMETFMINFMNITDNSAHLAMVWETTRVRIPIEVEFDSQVMESIEKAISTIKEQKNPAGVYYQAASYFYTNDKSIEQALEWITLSVNMDEQPKFWVLHLMAKIQFKAGEKEAAKETATRSMELAKESGNNAYVAMNQELIKQIGG